MITVLAIYFFAIIAANVQADDYPILERSILVRTVPNLSKVWSLSVNIRPTGTVPEWSNIVHATTGSDDSEYGDRVPGLWFKPGSSLLHICGAVNGNKNYIYDHPTALPMNVFTNVKVAQTLNEGKYTYRIYIAGEKVHEVVNTKAREFDNVKLYAADPWYKPAEASINQLIYVDDYPVLEKSILVKTIPNLLKIWSLSVEIRPTGTVPEWSSIVHATIGADVSQYGDRCPGLWFQPGSSKLLISGAVNGNNNYVYNHPTPLPMNLFTTVKVEQTLKDGQYVYRIYIAGKKVHEVINTKPSEFENVKLYAADPWYKPAEASINQLMFDNNYPGLEKSKIVKTIPNLSKMWFLSVDIRPTGTVSGWTNILHATIGKDMSDYGDRVPGIWFQDNSLKLHIGAPINGNKNYIYDHPTPLPINVFTNVKVEQTLDKGEYVYRIYIGGEKVHEVVNTKPSEFENVKLYASDPWYNPAETSIDQLIFENDYPVLEKSTIVKTLPSLSKMWFLSVDIRPTGTVTGWSNILHATIGSDMSEYGDRVPGIWFQDNSLKLHICGPVNGNKNYIYDHPTDLPINVFTNVKVEQTIAKGQYLYRIYIAGEKVHEVVNTKASDFSNVTLFASDPWYKPAKVSINQLVFVDDFPVLEKSVLVKTIPNLSKIWSLSVEIKPTGTVPKYSSIVHATTGKDISQYGDRAPGIWFQPGSLKLHICGAVNGNKNYIYDHPTELPLNVFTNVKVEQTLDKDQYVYRIYIGGEKVHEVVNTKPSEFENVKLYAADPWYNPAKASIDELIFDNDYPVLEKSTIVKTVPNLSKTWSLSVDIRPTGMVTGWSNILHATIGSDNTDYGDRVPGIWFQDNSLKLHIGAPVNGNKDYIYDHPTDLPNNVFTNVKVEQTLDKGEYVYRIYIGGEKVHEVVNTKPSEFENVKLYASDPWYKPAKASINQLIFAGDYPVLEKSVLVKTIPNLSKIWTLSVEIQPTGTVPRYSSIVHATTGKDISQYGDRAPGIWFQPGSLKLHICGAVNGNKNYIYDHPTELPLNVFTNVKVEQTLDKDQYVYRIYIGGEKVHEVVNTKPSEFENVKLYAADPWYHPAKASINQLIFDNDYPVLEKSAVAKKIPNLSKVWSLSVEIRPTGTVSGWSNILHATIGSDMSNYGDRVPGIWFQDNSLKLHICGPVNENKNYIYDHPTDLPMNVFTNVKVEQTLDDGQYVYRIYIGGEKVHEVVNTKPTEFTNVTLYASDPWYTPAKASINEIKFDNDYPAIEKSAIVKTIPNLSKIWSLSVEIRPTGTVSGWSNILHATIGSDMSNYGDRVPGIWFQDNSLKLHICAPVNGNKNYIYDHPTALPINAFTKVRVEQTLVEGQYVYRIYIADGKVHEVINTKPRDFKNVKLYASDPWYKPAKASINELVFDNDYPVLDKSNIVKTIPNLSKMWSLSVEIRPTGPISGWSNILHATIGRDMSEYGDRVPGIWFQDNSLKLHICGAVNGNGNYIYDHPTDLPINVFTNVKVEQTLDEGQYVYRIYIAGEKVHEVVNTKASDFSNVKLYASDPWYQPAKASINELTFDNDYPVLQKSTVVKTIPNLSKVWSLSVEIRPTGTVSGWSNILHATIGGDMSKYGDRVPGIWFQDDSLKLHICAPVNGNLNYIYNHPTALPINVYTLVKIEQTLDGGKYVYRIYIAGEKVHEVVNTKPSEFENVKLYAADPWYKPAKASITELIFADNYPVLESSSLVKTIPNLSKMWSLSVEIRPTGTVSGWSNILHGTIGKDMSEYGDRVPGIWFQDDSLKLYICAPVNGNMNYVYDHPTALPINVFTKVKVEQTLDAGQYVYRIYIAGEKVHEVVNTKPSEFENVKLYASDPWYKPSQASINELIFDNDYPVVEKSTLVKTIPSLSKVWSLSVDIRPTGTVSGWTNILHATIGRDMSEYGDRVPGIWFQDNSLKLHICGAVNGNGNYIYDHPTALPMNVFTNVKVEQTFDGNQYIYRIYIAGEKAHEVVNTKSTEFTNVQLYASDPWYNPAKVSINQLVFANDYPVLEKSILVKTIPNLSKIWSLSVEIRPTGTISGWSNIIHATTGKNIFQYGDRVPGLWFKSGSSKLHICGAVNGNKNYIYDHPTDLPMNVFTNVKVEQTLNAGQYVYRIYIGGEKVHEVVNTKPSEFENVKLYAADPWYKPAKASINQLIFDNEYPLIDKSSIVKTIPNLSKVWSLSVAIRPTGTVTGWSNILHATIGSDMSEYGDRVPGIWFQDNSLKLHIGAPVNGNKNYIYDHSTPLPMNVFTNVKVEQTLDEGQYILRIYVAGEKVHQVINKMPTEFTNVTLYASDPWYTPAKVSINDLTFDNDYQLLEKSAIVKTIPNLSKVWSLSVEIRPTGTVSGWSNILHATIGKDMSEYGDRVPGLWFQDDSLKLHICGPVNGNKNYIYDHPTALPINVFTNVKVEQSRQEGQYFYRIYIGGEKVHEVVNTKPTEFKNVTLYASDPWYKPAKASINELTFNDDYPMLEKAVLVKTLPKLSMAWSLSVEIRPTGTVPGWSSIVHATVGRNNAKYGDRVPGIWFKKDSSKLHICAPVNGNRNYIYDHPTDLPKNVFTSVKVEQTLDQGQYIYRIYIGGEKVHEVLNTKPSEFENVKLYAADQWYKPAKASINQLLFDNDYPELEKSKIVKTIPNLSKVWSLSVEIRPTGTVSGWSNILHATIGSDMSNYGDRVPGIWFQDNSLKLHICGPVNGNKNYIYDHPTDLPINVFTNVKVEQTLDEGQYVYRIYIAGEKVHEVVNTKPSEFTKVTLYTSDPWYKPAKVSINDLTFDNDYPNLQKSAIVKTIPNLSKMWSLSVEIRPTGTVSGWTNILHATIGSDMSDYGDRVPGIWFQDDSLKLHIGAPINGNKNYIYDHPTDLPINVFTNVKVEQTLDEGQYIYKIYIAGEKVHEVVNTKPSEFENVKLYAADPWYKPAKASINELVFDNDYQVLEKSAIVKTMPSLSKIWSLSVEIKPTGTVSGWSNILHATIGKDMSEYGDRVPGIWFQDDSLKLHICGPVNGNLNYIYDHPSPLQINVFTNVKVEQTLDKGQYIYRIYIKDKKVHEVINTKPKEFTNVTLYAADPWYKPAKAIINHLTFADDYPELEKSILVKTIPNLSKTWSLSVEVRPTGTVSGWSNIIHATTGKNIVQYGDRVPGLWFKSGSTKLHICGAVNGNKNYIYDHPTELPLNIFTNVKVEQTLDKDQYVYRIYIAGEKVHEVVNTKPSEFENVKLYAADPWYKPAKASINELMFDNDYPVLEKAKIIKTIPNLSKVWSLSVEIKPTGTVSGWSNILHATIGSDNTDYGDRVPGIWFQDNSLKLHIGAPVNGNKDYIYDHPTDLPINAFTNVKVEQMLDGGQYVYRIYIAGEKVHEVVNTKPSEFTKVTLYASDPWYKPAKASINDLIFADDYEMLQRSKLVKTIPNLSKMWSLSVDIRPTGTVPGLSNIVHATVGGDKSQYGDRVPGIWLRHKSSKLHISGPVNGNTNYRYNHPTALPMNVFTNVKVEQTLDEGKYVYRIYIAGEKVHEVVNTKPSEFDNVKLYAADPWYKPAEASINHLIFDNDYPVLEKSAIVKTIPNLSKVWSLSVEIKPTGTVSGWSNILHATIGSDNTEYGDRVPGIWFQDNSLKLHIGAPVNGNKDYIYDHSTDLPINAFTNVKVEQTLDGGQYVYRIYIAGKKVHEVVNTKPTEFTNVTLYAADPWYKPAKASIDQLIFDNDYPMVEKSAIVKTISTLSKIWSLSVDIRPTDTVTGWSNILHATIGRDMSEYGDRVPGIWFQGDSLKLHICGPVNGNKNYIYDHPTALPINVFTNVKVEQTLHKGQYIYRIYIAGGKVHEVVNTKPSEFTNVTLYAADPWYKPAKASINHLTFDDDYPMVKKGVLVKTIPKLSMAWSLSVDIRPTGTVPGFSSIVHATTGKDVSQYGDRVPGLWFNDKSSKLLVSAPINGNKNYVYNHPTALPMNEFTSVKVEQTLDQGQYVYRIYIGGEKVHEVVNTKPSEFENVKLYAADPWYKPAKASINELMFDNFYPPLEKATIVKTLPNLSKVWSLSVEIRPTDTVTGWSNILHATVGSDNSEYGDRVPGIWFQDNSLKLHIGAPVNGNKDYIYDHPTDLPINVFTNVKVEQTLSEGQYVYRIYIGGEKVHEVVNTKPSEFENVKLYAADPWYKPANASINELILNNDYPMLEKSTLVKTIPNLSKVWSLSVGIRPTGTVSGWSNILHATIGKDISEYGDRVPGIWFQRESLKLHICGPVNGNKNYIYDHPTPLPMDVFTNIKVDQILDKGKYIYRIFIAGEKVHEVVNTKPSEFKNVKLYAADPWFTPAKARINDLIFNNDYQTLEKSALVQILPNVLKAWSLSVNIRPIETVSGWTNILHATIGSDMSDYGDRVPGIWFQDNSLKLHICAPVNGNKNYIYDHATALPIDVFTNVKIEQKLDNGQYIYRIYIAGEKVHEIVNSQPTEFENVKLYAADPWYNPAKANINELIFDNEYPVLEKSILVKTIPNLSKIWSLSVEIRPTGRVPGFSSIVHATTGKDVSQYGDRVPGIWFNDRSSKLLICAPINGNKNYIYNHPTALPMNEFTSVKVEQTLDQGQYVYRIYIADEKVHEVVNTKPSEFENVKLYAADPWYKPAKASINKLVFDNDYPELEKSKIVKTVPNLSKIWSLSVEIRPTSPISGWSNILHATIGKDMSEYGDRVPGIWFQDNSLKLHIGAPVNGNKNYIYDHPTDLPINVFTNVKVEQTLDENQYIYRIYIGGVKVHEVVNTKPSEFSNVVLYASDPWYTPANASINHLIFGGDYPLLEKSTLVKTIANLSKVWFLSVDIRPTGTVPKSSNIIHATLGKNNAKYGDRVPGLWFKKDSSKLHICGPVNGNKNYIYNHPTDLPINVSTNVKVEQTLDEGQYVYRIYIGGEKVHEVVNTKPSEFENVQLYASDPWYTPAKASINQLIFDNKHAELEKSKIVKTIPNLSKVWSLSVEIKPTGTVSGWTNILHATIGRDMSDYGDRVPGIWFQDNSLKLHIGAPINGNKNYIYDHPTALPINVFTNVKVKQTLDDGQYVYRIYIAGEKVHEVVNTQPSEFENVKLYAADPWYKPAKASINQLTFDNDYPELEKSKIMKTVPNLSKIWSLSVEIRPTGTVPGWSNILHATIGTDNTEYGDRVPGIWFQDNSLKLHICGPVNGNKDYIYDHPTDLPINVFTNVKVEQTLDDGQYVYRIYIAGEKVHEVVNTKPSEFGNVKVYASDPWYNPAKASINELIFPDNYPVLEKSKLVKTIPNLSKIWSLSVEIRPTGTVPTWSNIVHATVGKDKSQYGDRVPGIWFKKGSSKLHICGAVNGNKNYIYNHPTDLPMNVFTIVKVEQTLDQGQYIYRIYIAGEKVHEVINTKPSEFENVKLYAADPWYNPAKANINQLTFDNDYPVLEKSTIVKTVPNLSKTWSLSVEIRPTSTVTGWSNILHATIGGDMSEYGDRVPGIWFQDDSLKLHICAPINGNNNYIYDHPTALPINVFTNVKIEQTLDEGQYIYRIYIAGEKVHEVINTKPSEFEDVKLYAADPWYKPAKASINQLVFDNDYPVLGKSVIVKTLPNLSKIWSLSVDVRPTGTVSGWSNILHATIGGDMSKYGDRVPGIWFQADSLKLHICAPVNGNKNYIYDHRTPLPINVFTNIKIEQTQKKGSYVYTIYIAGEKVHRVINKEPSEFTNVTLYAADPWYKPAKASISHLTFADDYPLLEKSVLVKTVPNLSKMWSLSVEIRPTGMVPGFSSIVHATTGKDVSQYGDRVPGLWFNDKSSKLLVSAPINGNKNYVYNHPTALPMNEFTSVKVEQTLDQGQYVYRIYIGGEKVHEVVNTNPSEFENVKLYAADPWYKPAKASINELSFNNDYPVLEKSKIVKTIPMLSKIWSLSVEIRPTGTVSGWSNILHATIGSDKSDYGDRVPGIWFQDNSLKLHICGPVNGNNNYIYDHPTDLPINVFTNVKVEQTLDKGDYIYRIYVAGEKVHEVVNTKPTEFTNVTLYASDPWYTPAKASINEIKFADDYPALEKATLVKTIPNLSKMWSLSVDIRPTETVPKLSNIFHATTGKDKSQYGDRVPAVWFLQGTTKLHICAPVNGRKNYRYNHPTPLPLNVFTNLKIEQTLDKGQYVYRIYIAGEKVHEIFNTKPSEFENVKLYAADPWYTPAKASINQLIFDNDYPVLENSTIVETIPNLLKAWSLSVEIKPTGTVSGWSNILHATIGSDNTDYGDRVPGIWFQDDSLKLHIGAPVNGNKDYIYDHSTDLPMNIFTNVKVEQTLDEGKYIYRIYIAGEKVHEVVNTQPSEFTNVKLYAADPWYKPAKVNIDQLIFVNDYPVLEKSTIVKTIPKLSKVWSLSVDIRPTGTVTGWSNILHATIGSDMSEYGDRVPGIWFQDDSLKLHICGPVNGNKNYIYDHPTALPIDVFTNVKVEQTLNKGKYMYRIYIAGDKVHEVVNAKPTEFTNITLYAADPWYKPAKASINNLIFADDYPMVKKGILVKTIPNLSKSWSLSVEIKPTETVPFLSNILHATIGRDKSQEGDRVPGIWFRRGSSKLHFCAPVNGNKNYIYDHPTDLPINVFTNVKVEQTLDEGHYVYRIYIGGEKVHEVVNTKPSEFENVKLYAADPWYKPAKVSINELEFDNDYPVLQKSTVVKTIPILSKAWSLSVEIRPTGTVSGWSNILHATIGKDMSEYGDRVPGIWFQDDSLKLHIGAPVNGNKNYLYDHPTDLPLNVFTKVKVEQTLTDGNYVYRIYIAGEKVHEVVNKEPTEFMNVTLFASDPWYKPAKASINQLIFSDDYPLLEKAILVKTIPNLSKAWFLSVDIKPTETVPGLSNILHGTIGGDKTQYGDRVPGIWFRHGSSSLHISAPVNGRKNYVYNHPTALPMNVFTNVKIEQTLDEDQYVYRIYIAGEKVHEVVNTKPSEFENVKLYAADPWYKPAKASINQLIFTNDYPVLQKSSVVKTLPDLSKSWSLSVDIRPTGTVSGWSNILHATIGKDMSDYGDRVPGIWFQDNSLKLHICAPINGNNNYIYDHPTALPLNVFTNVKVEQLLDEGQYVYRIYIAGEKVHEVVNTKPSDFFNVTLYAADPWYKPAKASINQLIFCSSSLHSMFCPDNDFPMLEKSTIVKTIPNLSKAWTLSVEVRPTSKVSEWSNILHATIGNDMTTYGDRVPGIWFQKNSLNLHIGAPVNGNKNYIYDHPTPLPINVFTNIKVEQTLDKGEYTYRIYIGGEKVHEVVNTKASDFSNVTLYASDPWYQPAKASVNQLVFDNLPMLLTRNNLITTIPELSKTWSLVVNIKPLGTQPGWSNIVHATTGKDVLEYGSRIPGIWFHTKTSKLLICSAVNGEKNYQFSHPTPLPMNVFTNVKIEQILEEGKYFYRIYIGGEKVHEVVNTKASEFKEVKLYASDPWYKAANANIDLLKFDSSKSALRLTSNNQIYYLTTV